MIVKGVERMRVADLQMQKPDSENRRFAVPDLVQSEMSSSKSVLSMKARKPPLNTSAPELL
jgi:hypothetical protein